jgi:hypothetical protein
MISLGAPLPSADLGEGISTVSRVPGAVARLDVERLSSPRPPPGISVREKPRPNRRYNSGRVHASHRPAINLVEMGNCGVQHGDVSRWSENPSATTLRRTCTQRKDPCKPESQGENSQHLYRQGRDVS